ncbi:MAG: hypothetical protein J07HX64_02526 [halophilic archaeon J07HX64]|nr:MAG: hypothetical protein J07HX64_02526 [halophilic archaeon J07HX64]
MTRVDGHARVVRRRSTPGVITGDTQVIV